jgi:hypothetical protein
MRASGPWYRRTSDAIEGSIEGVPFRLDTYVVSTGHSHVTFTRATSPLERPVEAKLTISPRTILTGIGENLGLRSIRTGDPAFDAGMVLRSKDPRTALCLVDEAVRSRMRALKRRASLHASGSEVKVRWRGAERDAAALDAACELVAAVARASARA